MGAQLCAGTSLCRRRERCSLPIQPLNLGESSRLPGYTSSEEPRTTVPELKILDTTNQQYPQGLGGRQQRRHREKEGHITHVFPRLFHLECLSHHQLGIRAQRSWKRLIYLITLTYF